MAKINKNLSRLYACPPEKMPDSIIPKVDNSLIVWYDNLRANPLLSYFTNEDIININKISTSVALSNNPREKYRLIGEIMAFRNFKFIGGGTNRRTYACMHDSRVVAKVGTDKVGFSNNLREYVNQNVLKPFCCKVFETSPCGTLAIIERVYPIKNMEEFREVGYDIFEALYFKIRSKNIAMEDIGMRSYKNWGIRDNFGAVLLDYPTMYVADKKKCFCTAVDRYGNYCNHTLDYDEGFDNIRCTACGRRYLSKSIAKTNGDSITELIYAAGNKTNMNFKGETKMKISFVARNGKVIEKDLSSGKNDHVTVQYKHNPYVPLNTDTKLTKEEEDAEYLKKFGHKRHNLKVSFTRPTQVEPVEEPEVVESKVVDEDERMYMNQTNLYYQLSMLTMIENAEISEVMCEHIFALKKGLSENYNIDMPFKTMKDGLAIFKFICKKFQCDAIYEKLVKYCSVARTRCLCAEPDMFEIVSDAEFRIDNVFYKPIFDKYMERVISVLRVIANVGFTTDILTNDNAIDAILILDTEEEDTVPYYNCEEITYIAAMEDIHCCIVYEYARLIEEDDDVVEEETVEEDNTIPCIDDSYEEVDMVSHMNAVREYASCLDNISTEEVPVSPEKARVQDRYKSKNRKKNRNINFDDCAEY